MSPYLLHFAYLLMLCAFITRDVLILRSLLFVAQLVVVTYTFSIGVWIISEWNLLYAMINMVWVVMILRERRAVTLPAELRQIHAGFFSALTPAEFLKWWKQGHRETVRDAMMARVGETPDALFFLLSGTVRVTRGATHITDLPGGSFVAEMSLLTGELPTADALAIGDVDVMRWPTATMRRIADRDPKFWSKIQSVLGRDLVEKIKRAAEERPATMAMA